MRLSQGETSGPVEAAARKIEVEGLYFLDRTKAVVMAYLALLLKGVIPPYYSYNRKDGAGTPTVQAVVAMIQKSVTDKDWMKIQGTMDTLENLVLAGEVQNYLMWPNLATSAELSAVKAEMAQYFELDNTKPAAQRTLSSLLGFDISQAPKYLMYIVGGVLFVMVLPSLAGVLSQIQRRQKQ